MAVIIPLIIRTRMGYRAAQSTGLNRGEFEFRLLELSDLYIQASPPRYLNFVP